MTPAFPDRLKQRIARIADRLRSAAPAPFPALNRAVESLGRAPVLIPLTVALVTYIAFHRNAALFVSGRLDWAWYDPAVMAVLVLPPLVGHLIAWTQGWRGALWWALWTPGVLLYWLSPWPTAGGWVSLWYRHGELWTLLRSLVWEQGAPLAASVRLSTALAMALVTLMVVARPWMRGAEWIRQQSRVDGAGSGATGAGGGEGLPRATWASTSEVRKTFSHPGGIVLGEHTDPLDETPGFDPTSRRRWKRQGKGQLITMDPALGNGHVVVLAASAGYKTAGIVIPNILHYDGPLVVVDPKGDLYARTRAAREDKGYTARVIDARNGFDPFKMIAPLAPEAPSVYLTMARTLMPLAGRGSDISEYFHEMSTALFAALMAHFIHEKSNNIAGDISAFINRKREEVIQEAQNIAPRHGFPFIADEMKGLAALDDRTFPGVVKGISNKLAFTRFPDVAAYGQSKDSPETHLEALGPKTDIFINVPTLAAKDFSSFPRLLIGAMYVASELLEQPDRPRARRLFLIDEARVLGGMDALTNVRDAGRSIGLHLMLIYQNYGQLKQAWGGDAGADAWLDSCEARVISAVGSSRTANDIITMLGRQTLRLRMQGSSSSNPVMAPVGGSVSSSEQEQLREVPLMSASALGQLPAHGEIIFTRRSRPILATKAIYFTRPDMNARVKTPDAVAGELDATRRRVAVMARIARRKTDPDGDTPQDTGVPRPDPDPADPDTPLPAMAGDRQGCDVTATPAPGRLPAEDAGHPERGEGPMDSDPAVPDAPDPAPGARMPLPDQRAPDPENRPRVSSPEWERPTWQNPGAPEQVTREFFTARKEARLRQLSLDVAASKKARLEKQEAARTDPAQAADCKDQPESVETRHAQPPATGQDPRVPQNHLDATAIATPPGAPALPEDGLSQEHRALIDMITVALKKSPDLRDAVRAAVAEDPDADIPTVEGADAGDAPDTPVSRDPADREAGAEGTGPDSPPPATDISSTDALAPDPDASQHGNPDRPTTEAPDNVPGGTDRTAAGDAGPTADTTDTPPGGPNDRKAEHPRALDAAAQAPDKASSKHRTSKHSVRTPRTRPSRAARTERSPQHALEAGAVSAALDPYAEDLFRKVFGEPVRPRATDWRPRAQEHISMATKGERRGQWYNHKTRAGGDIFDLVAIALCDLPDAKADFPRVLDTAATYAGYTPSLAEVKTGVTEPRATRRRAREDAAQDANDRATLILTLHGRGRPLAGSPAAAYLASRGITRLPDHGLEDLPRLDADLPDPLRHRIYGPDHPALLVWVTDAQGVVTGGQRILIAEDGSTPSLEVGKPAFGRIKGSAARFPAIQTGTDAASRPLVIAEGPESALSIRQETGFETWAVLGVAGFASAAAPTDREVILAPDRDAPDSPAGRTFRKAVAHHLGRGCDLRIAWPPEPVGSKRDFNDTLRDQGGDAVRAAFEAAQRPAPDDLPDRAATETADQPDKQQPQGDETPDDQSRGTAK